MVKAGAPEAGWWSGCGSLGTQGTLCSSALRLDGQANPGVNESSLHGSFHPGIKKGCSEPRSMSRGVTADRQPPRRRNTNPGSWQNIPPKGERLPRKAPSPGLSVLGPQGSVQHFSLICLCYVLPQPGWEAAQASITILVFKTTGRTLNLGWVPSPLKRIHLYYVFESFTFNILSRPVSSSVE